MPIYVEAKGIGFDGNPLFSHAYLVYVPIGQENNYAVWRTIGAYPTEAEEALDFFGSNTSLNAEFIDDPLSAERSKDAWNIGVFDGSDVSQVADDLDKAEADVTVAEMVSAGYGGDGGSAAISRSRTLVYEGADEAAAWASMIVTASDLSNQYTYRVVDLDGGDWTMFGPTVNSNSFIASVLRHEENASNGRQMLAFGTRDTEPGEQTWLGLTGADRLDQTVGSAAVPPTRDLFGGGGADTLLGGDDGAESNPIYLVAEDDLDQDSIVGGSGHDILVGYYNQNELSQSDILLGGSGNDSMFVVDPDIARPGGIPDPESDPPLSGGRDFAHEGTVSGIGGLVDGGAGADLLSFRYIAGSVLNRPGFAGG